MFILNGRLRQVAFLSMSSWCLVIAVWLFLAVSRICVQFVIVVFPDHTHLLFTVSCVGFGLVDFRKMFHHEKYGWKLYSHQHVFSKY